VNNEAAPYSYFFQLSVWLILALPLLSFLSCLVISRRYSWLASLLGPLLLFLSAICSAVVFARVWHEQPFAYAIDWFQLAGIQLSAGVLVNDLTALMLIVVTIVSFLVHLFSIGYMAGDPGERRYFAMLGLFTFSMLGIVMADNLLLVFIFWELVGFSSYMLIGHWKEKPSAAAAAKKAFILNRIGDAGFLIGLMILWSTHHTFNLADFTDTESSWNTAAALLLFCGVIGKSAQFPLFSWLPDAMEGPTPVSALIHAATMVAAGVFLLARINFMFTDPALAVVAIVGIITALLGGFAALAQNDIKRILAFSTISQLGLMVTAIGAGSPEAAILHLFTHAFFKACLFLCAGSVIHSLHRAQHESHAHFDVQDIRNLGGLRTKLPFTFLAVLISGAALSGIPFFSGFLSKEAIFNALYLWKGTTLNGRWIIFALAFVVSFLTVLYMARFVMKIFFGTETATQHLPVSEPPHIMRAPIALLALASGWFVVSWNPLNPHGWLLTSGSHNSGLTLFSIGWILLALLVSYLLYRRNLWLRSDFLLQSFYIDRLYHWVAVSPVLVLADMTGRIDRRVIDRFLHGLAYFQVTLSFVTGWIDSAIIDGFVNFMATASRNIGWFTRSFQSGKIQLYVFWAVFTIVIFLIWSLI
jgi:NADH-quinone oxidoreductase subunit L